MYDKSIQKSYYDLSKQFLAQTKVEVEDIDTLRKVLIYHEWKYYVQSDPVLSDYEYDMLYKMLEKLELQHPDLVEPDSPTQRVASDLNGEAQSVAHIVPMLSLGNSYNAEDLQDFDRQIRKLTDTPEGKKIAYCVEPKYDGGSIALVYENDLLVRAATRGNGTYGEEMTNNAKAIPSIPLKAAFSNHGIAKAELRGEAVIQKDNFDKINAARSAEGLALFANPRNAATGGLRMKDPNETRKRGLEAFIFQFGYAVDAEGNDMLPMLKTHNRGIDLLGELGFKVPVAEKTVVDNIADVAAFCQKWEAQREAYGYEIDGMVVKVDDLELQEKCGYTQHHPRWAIAYKFKAKQATTKLLNIEYQIGKIGSVTPVAKLDPVALAGVTVSSVSLHNEEFITSKDLRIGDTVVVERAGDVIPYIVKSLEELRDGSEVPVVFPKHCPSCESILEKEEDQAAWRCVNVECPAQQLQKIIFHVSKVAMDIDGFGKSNVEKFFELGWLRDISDVYNLPFEEIESLEGFGSRSVKKLMSSIEEAKSNPISKLLHSLSVHHLGKKASKLIAEHIEHVLDLQNWTDEDFTNIKDIGPVVATNVQAYFSNPTNVEMLHRMESRGVNLSQTEEDKPLEVADDAPLLGKTILFTGSLQQLKRKEAQEIAAANGAKNISAVSSNLDILVVGEKAGSKLKKAEALGTVQIMTEAEFVELVSQ